jgi:hypothetical protein
MKKMVIWPAYLAAGKTKSEGRLVARKRIRLVAATQRRSGARTARSWAKKGNKSYFGFKLHSKLDTDLGLIRALETTTASVHDGQVDLANEGEVVYRDRS